MSQRAIILGLGSSGEAAANLLHSEGADVTVVDRDLGPHRATAETLRARGVRVEESHQGLPAGEFDLCVVSPGIAVQSPWVQEAYARGMSVRPELELGWSRRATGTRVFAVTGTNGKSNAVKWVEEALTGAGWRTAIAGNYGPPVCRVVREEPALDWLVLEVSSFQLETINDFRAEIGLVLNLVPNHLNRHGTFEVYRAAKARLFHRAEPSDLCLVHEDCAAGIRADAGGAGRWFTFGSGSGVDFLYREGSVFREGRPALDLNGTYFGNEVLGVNAAGVAGGWLLGGLDKGDLERAARRFQPLPHRMETVAVARGVRWINDSKSTTLAALSAAVRMSEGRVHLIAGGLLKEYDLAGVKEVLARRAAGVYLIGEAAEPMAMAWSGAVPCRMCGTLDRAVVEAGCAARAGETILLSPGCASFDQFSGFEDRGRQFRAAVTRFASEGGG